MATSTRTDDPQVQTGLALLQDMFRGYARDFAVRFWDGTSWEPEGGQPVRFTLVLNHVGALRSMLWPPRPLSMGQAYIYDDFNIEGDMLGFCALGRHLENLKPSLPAYERLKLGWRIWNLPKVDRPRTGRQVAQMSGQVHSKERDRQAISYHYDTSNRLFELVLDSQMMYTSGLWTGPDDDLESAQKRKQNVVADKLDLRPGERLLDIGCGWGGFLRFAAKEYGVESVGATISRRQAEYAIDKIKQEGLDSRCRIDLVDYRDIDESRPFDKISLLEVGEHFGAAQFPVFFRKCWKLLRPGGTILIQQITLSGDKGLPAAREVSERYIFPDGELLPASAICKAAEGAGFEVRDVEGLREHYPYTLRAWLHNLETNHDEIVRATDEATWRVFRLYFAGACWGYLTNVYHLHHFLFVKPDPNASGWPRGRADWYDGNQSASR